MTALKDVQSRALEVFIFLSRYQGRVFVIFAQLLFCEFLIAGLLWHADFQGIQQNAQVPFGMDFLNVYAAGILANQGLPGAVYDMAIHGQMERAVAGHSIHYLAWHYPPTFLFVASLCALLPFSAAFSIYIAAGYAGYWAALRRAIPKTKESFWMLMAFPGAFCNFFNGQNGFLTTAFFGMGALFLETRPMLAGAGFGLLSYKPQFFVLIPLFLALGKHWRTLFWTLATALVCVGLSVAIYGVGAWIDFFNGIALTRQDILEEGWAGWHRGNSVLFAVRLLGGGKHAAYALQGIAAVAALACAAWIWRLKADHDVRIASLCAGMMLTTPYLMDYDMTMMIVPMALWTQNAVKTGFRAPEKLIYGLFWFFPLFARKLNVYGLPLAPLALFALLILSFYRAKKKGGGSGFAPLSS